MDNIHRIFNTLTGILHIRLELIPIELEEEKKNTLGLLLMVGVTLIFTVFGVISLLIFILLSVSPEHRLIISGGASAVFLWLHYFLWFSLKKRLPEAGYYQRPVNNSVKTWTVWKGMTNEYPENRGEPKTETVKTDWATTTDTGLLKADWLRITSPVDRGWQSLYQWRNVIVLAAPIVIYIVCGAELLWLKLNQLSGERFLSIHHKDFIHMLWVMDFMSYPVFSGRRHMPFYISH